MEYASKAIIGTFAAGKQEARKVSQLEEEITRLDAQIGRMDGAVQRLGSMLSGVLRSEPPPTPNKTANEIGGILVQRAEQIRQCATRIALINEQFDSIAERLEI